MTSGYLVCLVVTTSLYSEGETCFGAWQQEVAGWAKPESSLLVPPKSAGTTCGSRSWSRSSPLRRNINRLCVRASRIHFEICHIMFIRAGGLMITSCPIWNSIQKRWEGCVTFSEKYSAQICTTILASLTCAERGLRKSEMLNPSKSRTQVTADCFPEDYYHPRHYTITLQLPKWDYRLTCSFLGGYYVTAKQVLEHEIRVKDMW